MGYMLSLTNKWCKAGTDKPQLSLHASKLIILDKYYLSSIHSLILSKLIKKIMVVQSRT